MRLSVRLAYGLDLSLSRGFDRESQSASRFFDPGLLLVNQALHKLIPYLL
jgi:hypothetical protein